MFRSFLNLRSTPQTGLTPLPNRYARSRAPVLTPCSHGISGRFLVMTAPPPGANCTQSTSSVAPSLQLSPGVVQLPPVHTRRKIPPVPERYTRLPPHAFIRPLAANESGDDEAGAVPDYLQLILTSRCYELVKETPMTDAVNLGRRLGVRVGLKREDLQPVFSFKIRGAYNMMAHLSEEERWKGVVACSAGNHAQGVALSARQLGVAATIVMPLATPSIKHQNVSALGAKVLLHGDDFDSSKLECARLAKEHGLTDIPPYDEPHVIAGQGTLAMEILRQTNIADLEAIFVCVGGGGMLAGVAAYVKRIAPPHVKVIGVEALDQTAMTQSLLKGERVELPEVGLFSDGTAVRKVGKETFRLVHELVDAMVIVSNDEVCAAIKDVFEDTRSIPEPSGALAVAGLKRYVEASGLIGSGKRFIAVASGANMNFDRLRFVAERAALGEGKEVLLSVLIPELPGSFVRLHSYIHPRAVTEFSYRYSSPSRAYILVSFGLSSPGSTADGLPHAEAREREMQAVLSAIKSDPGGMEPMDLSDNEVAKSHVRYLVGGRKNVPHERLISFAFPERPGALRKFLVGLGEGQNKDDGHGGHDASSFNVSLFHYRNLGGDVSRVLAGIQVPPGTETRFHRFLQELGYPYVEETNNVGPAWFIFEFMD